MRNNVFTSSGSTAVAIGICISGYAAAAAAKSLQSCPTLCDPRDCGPPRPPVPGILQTRVLEWGAIVVSVIYLNNITVYEE